jgi:hypothetical protein
MSLDVIIKDNEGNTLYEGNVTHNLAVMAKKCGVYEAIWRPYMTLNTYYSSLKNFSCYEDELEFESSSVIKSWQIIELIEKGLEEIKGNEEYYSKFDSVNGWGTYKDFLPFVEKYLEALKQYPKGIIHTYR